MRKADKRLRGIERNKVYEAELAESNAAALKLDHQIRAEQAKKRAERDKAKKAKAERDANRALAPKSIVRMAERFDEKKYSDA